MLEFIPTFSTGLAPCCAMGMQCSSSLLPAAWRSWRLLFLQLGQTRLWLPQTSRWIHTPFR